MREPRGPTEQLWGNRYEIVRTLGEGGMGRILLARDMGRKGRRVALKLLRSDCGAETAQFLNEFAVHRRLDHPNIPRAWSLGYGGPGASVPFFSMEPAGGGPLDVEARLPLGRLVDVAVGLLRGLDHIHRAGFVHRDLKPSNILVDQRVDGPGALQIIDFGVAVREGTTCAPEQFVGTPEYAAPELLIGHPVDARADLFSVGLVLRELVTGTRDWVDRDLEELIRARMGPPPTLGASECPPALADLIRQLLEPRREHRVPSAAAAILALAEATGRELEIEPPPAFERRLRQVRSHHDELINAAATELFTDVVAAGDGTRVLIVEGGSWLGATALVRSVGRRAALLGACVYEVDARSRDGGFIDLDAALACVAASHDRVTVIVVEGLEDADFPALDQLRGVLSAPQEMVCVVASVDPTASDAGPVLAWSDALGARRVPLAALTESEARTWLERALGDDGLAPADRAALLKSARGAPPRLAKGLADLYRQGRLNRTSDGYRPATVAHGVARPGYNNAEDQGHTVVARLIRDGYLLAAWERLQAGAPPTAMGRMANLRLRAEALTRLQWLTRALAAIDVYEHAAAEIGAARDHGHALALRAEVLRHSGQLEAALDIARKAVAAAEELGDDRTWMEASTEVAAAYLSVGWFQRANDLAGTLLEQDCCDDPDVEVRLRQIEARADAGLARRDRAWWSAQQAWTASGAGSVAARQDARALVLTLAVEQVGPRGLGDIGKEASEHGWSAHRLAPGARSARDFAIAALAALKAADGELACQWATLAVSELQAASEVHVLAAQYRWLAARAHDAVGDTATANRHRRLARSMIHQIAAQIRSPALRAAWLSHPENAAILVASALSPGAATRLGRRRAARTV